MTEQQEKDNYIVRTKLDFAYQDLGKFVYENYINIDFDKLVEFQEITQQITHWKELLK